MTEHDTERYLPAWKAVVTHARRGGGAAPVDAVLTPPSSIDCDGSCAACSRISAPSTWYLTVHVGATTVAIVRQNGRQVTHAGRAHLNGGRRIGVNRSWHRIMQKYRLGFFHSISGV
jgi:hypothetical protein